jgi:uncharacterized cupredoxin-like copper-binding protein
MADMRFMRALLVFLIPVLVACGSGVAKSATTDVKVSMTEFTFQPAQFTVPAGQEITLEATNNGAIVHNFVILKLGSQVTLPFSEDDEANAYWKLALNPGESIKTSFIAPSEPGDYQVVCSTAGHAEAGMIAKLTVVKTQP